MFGSILGFFVWFWLGVFWVLLLFWVFLVIVITFVLYFSSNRRDQDTTVLDVVQAHIDLQYCTWTQTTPYPVGEKKYQIMI